VHARKWKLYADTQDTASDETGKHDIFIHHIPTVLGRMEVYTKCTSEVPQSKNSKMTGYWTTVIRHLPKFWEFLTRNIQKCCKKHHLHAMEKERKKNTLRKNE
jgi:hypothetical protein